MQELCFSGFACIVYLKALGTIYEISILQIIRLSCPPCLFFEKFAYSDSDVHALPFVDGSLVVELSFSTFTVKELSFYF